MTGIAASLLGMIGIGSTIMIRIKKRLWWGLGGLLVLTFACHYKLAYDHTHIPLSSAVIPRPYPQVGQRVDSIAYSPDGRTLVTVDDQSGISFWTTPQLRCERRFDVPGHQSYSAANWISRGGGTLIAGGYTCLRQWDISADKFIPLPLNLPQKVIAGFHMMPGQTDLYGYHAISPSGKLAAGANSDGDVAVWNLQTGRQLFHLPFLPMGVNGYPTDFCDAAFSPDDKLIATTSMFGDNSVPYAPIDIVIRDARTGVIQRKWQWKDSGMLKVENGNLSDTGLTFSTDGDLLATADDYKVVIWNVSSGKREYTLTPNRTQWAASRKKLMFFDSNRLLAGAGWGSETWIWSVNKESVAQVFYGPEFTSALAVSPDNRLLANGGQDKEGNGVIDLWDVSRL